MAIAIFLVINGLLLWIFPDTSILENGYASLDVFFYLGPYLFIFLIPAISMKAVAGEKADGTFILLLSRPISPFYIIMGKYLGVVCIAFLILLPTLIYVLSLYILAYPEGNIDIGALIGSYLGLMLLAASYSAISIFCSSLTKNVVIAFLLGVFATFFAYYGFEAIGNSSDFFRNGEFIQTLGIQNHYDSISRGVLIAGDLIYFLSVIGLFILFTIGHTWRTSRRRQVTLVGYGIALIVYFLLNNIVPQNLLGRIDFTEDKRFTLSDYSKETLKKLEDPVYITVFLDGNLPSGFNRLKQSTINILNDLKSYAKGNLQFVQINPLAGSDEEQKAFTQALINRGIYPTNLQVKTNNGLSQKLIFPSAVLQCGEQEITINLLQQKMGTNAEESLNNSIQNLEYALISGIQKVTKKDVGFIGFTEGHGEPSDLELYDAMHSLTDGNQVGRVNLDIATNESLQQLKLIFIVKPKKAFTEKEKYKLDYFIRHGGNVVWAIDQIDADMDHLRNFGRQPIIGRSLNLDDQLFLYGIRINYNLIADLNCNQIPITLNGTENPQIELVPWYFHPILMPQSTNPILKNLDGIKTEFISSIDTIRSPAIKKEVLLSSSPYVKVFNTAAEIDLQMVEQNPDPKQFQGTPLPIAVLLEGEFPYLFENRPVPNGIQTPEDLSNIHKNAKMIVVGDGDWLTNQIASKDQSPYPLGWDRYTERQFANKTLLMNMVDFLLNDESLINLRNREVKMRLLNPVKTKEDKRFWQIINIGMPLLILLLCAFIQQVYRRRKYG
ncbi:gliding motility-associated ABC transporter substrate-binding protein GldG [Sphingobacterium sp. LRF_L2]|uniref:gliding motility-associated ABC transporter substrate-binding protein GldG n=1 Tax=Sphingobacterium sp. LRF_L2 TaxID=3369421 RepID=UPI003F60803C